MAPVYCTVRLAARVGSAEATATHRARDGAVLRVEAPAARVGVARLAAASTRVAEALGGCVASVGGWLFGRHCGWLGI
jgi:hypothetical protein